MYESYGASHDEIEHCVQLQPAGLGEDAQETHNVHTTATRTMGILYFI